MKSGDAARDVDDYLGGRPVVARRYAYFDPSFDPALRQWLFRPAGRVVFAGEHTSVESQGFMNGAIESGIRAATEVRWMQS